MTDRLTQSLSHSLTHSLDSLTHSMIHTHTHSTIVCELVPHTTSPPPLHHSPPHNSYSRFLTVNSIIILDGKASNLLRQRTSLDFTSAVRSMNVHLDLAVTEDALKTQSGNWIGDDDDVEDDEEEDDDETAVGGEVQEVVAAGLFDWMGLSSAPVPAPVTVPAAGGKRACYITSYTLHFIIKSHELILFNVMFYFNFSYEITSSFITSFYMKSYSIA
jgi:hypothetical protein